MRLSIRPMLVACLLAVPAAWGQPADRGTPASEAPPEAGAAWTAEAARDELASILDRLDREADFEGAARAVHGLLEKAAAEAPVDEAGVIREIAAAERLVSQLGSASAADREVVYPFLREHPVLASTLAFLVESPHDKGRRVYAVLAELVRARGEAVARWPGLAAAICVVHDAQVSVEEAGGAEVGEGALRVFDHLTGHAGELVFEPGALPAALLVHVVDAEASADELAWAVDRFAGNRLVGKRYHDVTYDTRHYKMGADKRIGEHEYTLENLRRYGGVCTDQAYYAAQIGKAIGVPTASVVGRGGEVGHCWVGFVKRVGGGRLVWDFDEGRYEAFEDVEGRVRDPQTGRGLTDDELALTAELARTSREDRQTAAALLDALRQAPRSGGRRAALLRRAASLSPADARVWQMAARLAVTGAMPGEEMRRWANALHEHFGARYPSFTISILRPFIRSVDDPAERAEMWDWALRRFGEGGDLACEILIARAEAWRRAGRRADAYDGYVEAAWRHINDSGVALEALRKAERMLMRSGKSDHALSLYEEAWRRVRRPSMMGSRFVSATNWFKVGARYAELLAAAGREADARKVLERIGAVE